MQNIWKIKELETKITSHCLNLVENFNIPNPVRDQYLELVDQYFELIDVNNSESSINAFQQVYESFKDFIKNDARLREMFVELFENTNENSKQ